MEMPNILLISYVTIEDISLNPGSSQHLQVNDKKFEPFHKRGLHFLHINVSKCLLKINELRYILGHTKHIDLRKNEIHFLGDLNVNLLRHVEFILKENSHLILEI